MAKTVTFAFVPGDKIQTPLGEKGIVGMAAIDDTLTNKYYVEAVGHSTWWTGEQLLECNPLQKSVDEAPPAETDEAPSAQT